ncbi:endonuclease, partial [Polaribacter sp.]|nr:endonuclease [Polaribacter sp.]
MTEPNREEVLNIALYNVENLFDTSNDFYTNDDNFTPKGKLNWDDRRYYSKIKKVSHVIAQIGKENSSNVPVLVGLVEVENTKVLEDLVNHPNLRNHGYRYIHFNSNDTRGIDTALLYRDAFFDPINSKVFPLNFINNFGRIDHSRDILLVSGFLNNELIHVIVNHWPSRREGAKLTEPKRIEAAKLVNSIVSDIQKEDAQARIIVMGDFNDNPSSTSIKHQLLTEEFFNPMEDLHNSGLGSLMYKKKWFLFDQIILTKNFLDKKLTNHFFTKATIFNKKWLQTP